jgi:chitinase
MLVTALKVLTLLVLCLTASATSPQYVTYIDILVSYWPPQNIAASLGVPGYASPNNYTTINLSFWLASSGAADAALVWSNAIAYVSTQNPWGATTTAEVQKAWVDAYHAAGKSVLVSAFGSTDNPTAIDPTLVATNLAQFVTTNQLDGVDLDYEDTAAFQSGLAEPWLITCTNTLRSLLGPNAIITHAPQAPYFLGAPTYPNGAYLTIDQKAGAAINWYNVQFYNQGSSDYTTFETLFETSDGWAPNTSVMEINGRGIPLSKIVVGKPVTAADADNTGFIPVANFLQILQQAVNQTSWRAGLMDWEFSSDINGTWINELAAAF